MKRFFLLPLLLICCSVVAQSQPESSGGDRPDHGRRARPALEESYERGGHEEGRGDAETEKNDRPYLLRSPINRQSGFFLNRSTIVGEPAVNPPAQNESSIAISPLDPNLLISSAVDTRGAIVYVSTDGGNSWKNTDLGKINTNWQTGNDPSVGFDHLGNGYVMFGAFPRGNNTGESGVYLCKTTNGGASWSVPYVVIEHKGTMTDDSAFEDKYYIEADNSPSSPFRGNLYTPWKRVIDRDSSTQIVVARSTDGGATWGVPVRVSPRKSGNSLDTTFGQSFPITTTGPNGELYVAWNDGPSRSIGFVRSTDGGLTFSQPIYPVQNYPTHGTARTVGTGANQSTYHVLKGTFRAETYPTIMADNSNSPRKGWLYLAYCAGLTPDLYFLRSTDGGQTWTQPKTITSVTTNDQWWPWMSVDETTGDIAIMYSDSRNDPANIAIDTYISYSSDGGETWIDRRATDATSDFRKNPFIDQIFAGDYSGCAFHDGRIYPSHLDTRDNDNNDVYTAIIKVRQPYPVENLVAKGRFEDLTEVTLSWKNPAMESIFGKPFSSYTLELSRDGVPHRTLPSGTTTFTENGLTIGQEYRYEVRVAAGPDTSILRDVTFKPGDAKLPLAPTIVLVTEIGPQVGLRLKLPSLRADSVTLLNNLKGWKLYRDGEKVAEGIGDTGSVITVNDAPAKRGYYVYRASVVDASNPGNESANSDSVIAFGGPVGNYAEGFDTDAPKMLSTGTWGLTSTESQTPPNSLTDSPIGRYKARTNSFTQVWPVLVKSNTVFQFDHLAIIDKSDTGYVEISHDTTQTWQMLGWWNSQSYDDWKDTAGAHGKWHSERFGNLATAGEGRLVFLRFRISTGTLGQAEGWFVDNVAFTEGTVGADAERRPQAATIRPNIIAAHGLLEFQVEQQREVRVRLLDPVGQVVMRQDLGTLPAGAHSLAIDCSQLSNGSYFYELHIGDAVTRGRVMVHR
ncbi:MAG: hypothetical protein DYG96_05395 [Chlorobi bacterium CHB2]|nr:hypothetical protein [Chlorobi bacterium CHB2]